MLKQFLYWLYRKQYSIPCPQEMYEVLISIKKTYKTNFLNRPVTWETRKYKVCGEYALNLKSIDDIINEYGITRTRLRLIVWRVYHDYRAGMYNEQK